MPLITRLSPYLAIFLVIQTFLRASLLVRGFTDIDFSASETAQMFLRGLWLDVVTASFFVMPVVLYHLALPIRKHGSRLDRNIDGAFRLIFIFVLLFDAVAEHLFWSEFSTRFNFIAVDYLVYTQEVIGNIVESYPIGWIMLAIAAAAGLLTAISLRLCSLRAASVMFRQRLLQCSVAFAVCLCLYVVSNAKQAQFNDDAEAQEIAANGIYNLFYAFWNNEISYDRFYATEPNQVVAADVEMLRDEPYTQRVVGAPDNIRQIKRLGKETHKNVIIVVMESMSAAYMKAFGDTMNLTPNLDRFASEGLFFTHTYATGTRTVRGLEAVALSIPPTPGQSLLRRQGNDNLFSLGFIFKDRGYDTRFIYGGYGYFDNMNNFFASNGFDVIDRTSMKEDEIHFANIWGVADEDLFAKTIEQADISYRAHKPFAQIVMTTSNHRPYTYPDGRIDIPSHSNRIGGVKYADYSIGKLIEDAKKKPWFNDTVFVFVADHTAGASGKVELDPKKYHIPMIFYAPGFITPQRFDNIASQIDLSPILLGQLNFSYYSKFYGEDLMHDPTETPHAFVSNYQKVALVTEGVITILSPQHGIKQLSWPDAEKPITDAEESTSIFKEESIAYYQSASWWREMYKRVPTVIQ